MKQAVSDTVQYCDPGDKGNKYGESCDCHGFPPGGI